ncbi:unnamed protein product [Symbiodinium pilosum]|uniref:Uncharacterized protein n=1 Tax=Symbiodinium pilosum TaxID=2952 RepID=A0A812IUK4_SYMPI|nr:unnamed protein product [Symbiodinium pilosum]
MKLLVALVAVTSSPAFVASVEPPQDPLQGAIFFTSLGTKELVRLDCNKQGCTGPHTVATGMETYGGLLPWKGHLLAALKSHQLVQLDPWCQNSSCPVTALVDVDHVLGGEHGSYDLGGVSLCQDSLFIVFGGQKGATGVLRCTGCSPGQDCTSGCSLVDGGNEPGKGSQQLSAFAAGITCVDDNVLVTDNSNSRVQAIPAGCVRAPCDVKTFATGVKWPLGIAAVNGGRRVLVTLDEGIVSFLPNGTSQRDWSSRGDMGFLCEGGGRILAASGGDGNVVSFDPACEGPNCTATLVWNSSGSTARAASAIAYVPAQPHDGPSSFIV